MEDLSSLKIEKNSIRKNWHEKNGEWYFSIVDVVNMISKSSDPRNYWKVLKNRLKNSQNELVTRCNPLKMEASDGKFYLTDTGNSETILEILSLVSKENIPSFRAYFDSLGHPKSENIVSLTNQGFEPKKVSVVNLENESASYPQGGDEDVEFMISIDVYRKNNSLIIEAFIAGVSLSDLNIIATTQSISIKGHRELLNKVSEDYYQTQEISWGKFSRHIKLPYEVDINKIEATDERGLLKIRMPMINKSYTRSLKVKSI